MLQGVVGLPRRDRTRRAGRRPTAIREAIEKHAEGRFRDLDDTSERRLPVCDLLGYRFTHTKEANLAGPAERHLVWGFTAAGWREVLSGITDPKGIARMLAEQNVLALTRSDKAHRLI